VILFWTPATAAQQAAGPAATPSALSSRLFQAPVPGPLTLSAATSPLVRDFSSLHSGLLPGTAAARQYGWRRADRELGRTFLGSVAGFLFAWVADLAIHQEKDFSKANWLWNEGPDDKVQNGEVVYNILLYNGLTPLYAKRGIMRVSPVKTNGLATYLSGLAGSLLGMWYWTELDKSNPKKNAMDDIRGYLGFFGTTTLFTFLGHRIFK
jgi:hypothetical protein